LIGKQLPNPNSFELDFCWVAVCFICAAPRAEVAAGDVGVPKLPLLSFLAPLKSILYIKI
jgi:hypothetical protein